MLFLLLLHSYTLLSLKVEMDNADKTHVLFSLFRNLVDNFIKTKLQ
jgi:hypothetical protein